MSVPAHSFSLLPQVHMLQVSQIIHILKIAQRKWCSHFNTAYYLIQNIQTSITPTHNQQVGINGKFIVLLAAIPQTQIYPSKYT